MKSYFDSSELDEPKDQMDFYNLLGEDQKDLENTSATTESLEIITVSFSFKLDIENLLKNAVFGSVDQYYPFREGIFDLSRIYDCIYRSDLIFSFMIERSDPNLIYAICLNRCSSLEDFKTLVKRGLRFTPEVICDIAGSGIIEIVQYFLTLGHNLDVKIPDYQIGTPLETACVRRDGKNLDIMEMLVDHGANPYSKDQYGNRSIDVILVNSMQNPEIVEFALELGADPNFGWVENDPTYAPLFRNLFRIGGSMVDVESCVLLIRYGAVFDGLYDSDEFISEEGIQVTILDMLIEKYYLEDTLELHGFKKIVNAMVKMEPEILEKQDSLGRNPIRYAVDQEMYFFSYNHLIEFLMELGADPTVPDHEGNTALSVTNQPDILEILKKGS